MDRLRYGFLRSLRNVGATMFLCLFLGACVSDPPSETDSAIVSATDQRQPPATTTTVQTTPRPPASARLITAVPKPKPSPSRNATAATQPPPTSSATTPAQTRVVPTTAATPDTTNTVLGTSVLTFLETVSARLKAVAGSSDALHAGKEIQVHLEAAVLAFLNRHGTDLNASALLDQKISELPPHIYDFPINEGQRIALADVDGDGQDEIIAAFNIFGVRPVWFDESPNGYTARTFPTADSGIEIVGMASIRSTADLTSDGIADVLIVTTTPGPGTLTEDVRVYSWETAAHRVFDVPVISWAAPSHWRLRVTTKPTEIDITCTVLGHFDAKLLPHPSLTRTFAWDGSWFREISRHIAPPVSIHDQLNRAEASFWSGDYTTAQSTYLEVIQDPVISSADTAIQTDWTGLAHIRLAQLALLTGSSKATENLVAAVARGGNIALIAQAIETGFEKQNPIQPFVELQRLTLSRDQASAETGSIGFPIDPGLVLALGKALEIGLRDVTPDVMSASIISRTLERLGLNIRDAAVGDLNGDDIPEAIVSIVRQGPRLIGPPANDFWILYHVKNRWIVKPSGVAGDGFVTGGVHPIDEKQAAFIVNEPGTGEERSHYLSFDGQNVDLWVNPPTITDVRPANPFDSRNTSRCKHGEPKPKLP